MARDKLGRWLARPTEDDGRHYFSKLDCQKGFQAMLRACLSSRVRAHIRTRIRRYYQVRAARRQAARAAAGPQHQEVNP